MSITYEDAARVVLSKVRPLNPIVPATILADLGLINGTPMVQLSVGGAALLAHFPDTLKYMSGGAITPRVGYSVWAAKLEWRITSDWYVVATNYQVGPVATGGGLGNWATAGTWGSSGTWGVA